jgi:Outer membrane protein beta-barrel domain
MMHFRAPLLTIASALVCATAGMAQEIQPGVMAGLNIPMGDLGSATDHRLGFTIGGQLGIYYGGGHEVRPRVDYTHFAGGWAPEASDFNRNTISALGLGCDYLYYTEMRPLGVYLTMGLGYQWWTVNPEHGPNRSNSGLSVAAGAGYRFNRTFSAEARLVTGQFQSTNGQANAIQGLVSMRF